MQEILRTVRQRRLMEVQVLGDQQQRAARCSPARPASGNRVGDDNGVLRYEVQADERQLAEGLQLLLNAACPSSATPKCRRTWKTCS